MSCFGITSMPRRTTRACLIDIETGLALSGYRLVTRTSGTIVDACHIHQFARSRNNALNNGIALSKNAHWLFDNGLWSIGDDYTVLVAEKHFAEAGDGALLLARMKGRKITLPANPSHRPSPQHLAWHRNHRFLGSDEVQLPLLRSRRPGADR